MKAGGNVLWHCAVNGDGGHTVAGVAEVLERGRSLSFSHEARGVAGVHIY